MKEIKKTVYVAQDGREFDSAEKCWDHERRLAAVRFVDNMETMTNLGPIQDDTARATVIEYVDTWMKLRDADEAERLAADRKDH
jgi:hypothetical protein